MTKVLVADDDATILESTAELLRFLGFEVRATDRVEEVLTIARGEKPDILLQDVRMPDLNLVAHLRALRAEPALRGMSIVVFSASMDARDIAETVGADATLEKPFDPNRLKDALDAVVARRRR